MKKLTVKALKEMLNENFMIRNYIEVVKDKNSFYVVYRERVVLYRYAGECGWCFSISGICFYSDTKALLNIVEKLDENFSGDTNEDNK